MITAVQKVDMPTIRIHSSDKTRLDEICQETDLSHPDVFHQAITLLERERRAKQLQADFEALASDARSMGAYRKDTEVLDQASPDGIDE